MERLIDGADNLLPQLLIDGVLQRCGRAGRLGDEVWGDALQTIPRRRGPPRVGAASVAEDLVDACSPTALISTERARTIA
jgi:hypothetical protein